MANQGLKNVAMLMDLWIRISEQFRNGKITAEEAVKMFDDATAPVAIILLKAHDAGVIDLNNLGV